MASLTASFTVVKRFTLLAVAGFQTLLAVCPPGWLAWQDTCYILLPDRMDWWQAKEVCDRPGSSLFVPNSQEEEKFIWREMKVWMAGYGAVERGDFELWFGCKDDYNNGSLSCFGVSGDLVYKNWALGGPNNRKELCVRITQKFNGKWSDAMCDDLKYTVCEMRVSRVSFCMPTDADGQCQPHCLLNHGIKNLTTGVTRCASACWEEPRCHSFNHWQRKKDDAGTCHCQLNNATRLQAAAKDYKDVEDCYFYDL